MTMNTQTPVRRQSPAPLDKIVAVVFALPLIAAETGLNAEHLAASEGWASTLVLGAVGATLAAAAALPIAERALAKGYRIKAFGLGVFFALMLAASFSNSVGRVGGKHDGDVSSAKGHNAKMALAQEAYTAAQKTVADECTKRGPKCRKAEDAVKSAREAFAAIPAAKVEDPMARRLAAASGLSEATVALYQPLLFPLALQIGGFFFLAYGFAPAKTETPIIDVTPMVMESAEIVRELKVIEKPKAKARKAKPKAIAYQPAITAKFDGRKLRGIKSRTANSNDGAEAVAANANDA
jgi:hypothetical protein